MNETPRYWFKARTYGWGWGLPTAWQGWLVYAVALALLIVNAIVFPPSRDTLPYLGSLFLIVGMLVVVCALKGEPPRWRWGGKD